jgi:membrane-associated phospholipid phosphatase
VASKREQPNNVVEKADLAIAETFTPIRKRRAIKLLGKASEVGDQPPLYVIAGAVLATGVAMGDRRGAKAGLRMLASHFMAIRIKNAAKHLVDRTRPYLIADEGRYELRQGKRFDSDYNSFPSGHTASSVAVARALGREYPAQHGAALSLAGAIAGAQVVRSKHYASDLVAGALIGLLAEKLADLWLNQMARA